VRRDRGEQQAVGAEGDGGDFGGMVVQQLDRSRYFPQPDLAVNASCGKLASLRLVGDAADGAGMCADLSSDRSIRESEEVERAAVCGGNASAIVRGRSESGDGRGQFQR